MPGAFTSDRNDANTSERTDRPSAQGQSSSRSSPEAKKTGVVRKALEQTGREGCSGRTLIDVAGPLSRSSVEHCWWRVANHIRLRGTRRTAPLTRGGVGRHRVVGVKFPA